MDWLINFASTWDSSDVARIALAAGAITWLIYWLYLVWWVGRSKFKRRHGRPIK